MNIRPAPEVDRFISFYEKYGEKYIGEISLEVVKLSDLLRIKPEDEYKDDFLLFDCYLLDKDKIDFLAKLLNKEIQFDLHKYEYYLEASFK